MRRCWVLVLAIGDLFNFLIYLTQLGVCGPRNPQPRGRQLQPRCSVVGLLRAPLPASTAKHQHQAAQLLQR
jgi:hypothetical protein